MTTLYGFDNPSSLSCHHNPKMCGSLTGKQQEFQERKNIGGWGDAMGEGLRTLGKGLGAPVQAIHMAERPGDKR